MRISPRRQSRQVGAEAPAPITKLRRWWAMGSPMWRRLTAASAVAVATFIAAVGSALLGGAPWVTFGLAGSAAACVAVFSFTLVMARARGEHVFSPGWYLKVREAARSGR